MTTPDDPAGSNPYETPAPGSVPPPPPPGPPQYGTPPYGAPAPGTPPYGAPQWGGQPSTGTNGFAIASLVCAFLCSPLGIVFGILGMRQTRATGQNGNGLAVAGLILSIVFLLIGIVVYATTSPDNGALNN